MTVYTYIILNKLVLLDNILFQIIESKYINMINIKQFHDNVKVINSNEIISSYTIVSSFSLDIQNNYSFGVFIKLIDNSLAIAIDVVFP